MSPQISIIIPTLNEEEHLPSLLDSLEHIPEIEIIVSDGGSSDHSLEICSHYPVKLITGSRGRGVQLNRGAKLAVAPVLLFLHADCRLEPQVAEQVLQEIEAGCHWGCATMDFDERSLFFRGVALFSNLRSRYLKSCYGDQAMWCRKSDFIHNGQFPDIPLMEDLAFSHRMRARYRPRIVPGKVITSTRRFQTGGRFKTLIKMQVFKALYFLGVSPERLALLYGPK